MIAGCLNPSCGVSGKECFCRSAGIGIEGKAEIGYSQELGIPQEVKSLGN